MKQLITTPVTTVWEFDPSSSNADQPEFVSVTTQLGGPRAICRPPDHPIFYLAPGDVLVGFEDGRYIMLNGHAAAVLLA